MKLLTYAVGSQPMRSGALLDDTRLIDLRSVYAAKLRAGGVDPDRALMVAATLLPEDMVCLLELGKPALQAAMEAVQFARENRCAEGVYSLEEVRLGAPVPAPRKIICVGLNYKDHILEMKRDFPQFPIIFAKYATAVAGPYDEFPLNERLTQKLDYEAELAAVIGKRGKGIRKEEALDYVAGYTVVNDITARDMQKRTIQWLQGKTLDKSLPMGPYLVTSDEIPDPQTLPISLTVNGELRQSSNTEQLLFTVQDLVAFLSDIMTLEPGDVICTGTPGGVGEAQGKFLKAGDVVRAEIGGIGAIETRIVVAGE
jgi:acylpyruvate hydrolase